MNIEQRALEKYPVSIVDVPDIDEGCPSFYTEDENAIKRHYYIEGATDQKAIDDKDRVARMLKQIIKHGKDTDALLEKVCDVLRRTGYFETEEGISAEVLETQFRQTIIGEND